MVTRILSLLAILFTLATQGATSLDFSAWPGGGIQFNSDSTFALVPGVGGKFWSVISPGSSVGFFGEISPVGGQPWHYGSIQPGSTPGEEVAAITGPLGILTITDNSVLPFSLTATVDWMKLSTTSTSGGLGTVGALAVINVTGLHYAGVNPDLQALAQSGQYSIQLSFTPDKDLTGLSSGGGFFSYSGEIAAVVPEASTFWSGELLFGVLLLAMFRKPTCSAPAISAPIEVVMK